MKNVRCKSKKIGSILPISGFIFLTLLVLSIFPAFATDFEFGTQFSISRIVPEDDSDDYSSSITYTQIPSSLLYIGSSPTALYATWFPSTQFAIGPEFSLGRMSVSAEYFGESETESITTLYLGGRAAYFLQSHTMSNPYVLGRVSINMLSDEDGFFFGEDRTLTNLGIGLGYQWRIGHAFVLRTEAQYQRVFVADDVDEDANEFSLIIGLGTRFGNGKSSTPEVPNTQ